MVKMNAHELNNIMLYIHPPLSIIGYVFIFLFAILIIRNRSLKGKAAKISGASAWVFTFLGLITGMFWAQTAWGSYWTWDPKETMTLVLFLALSAAQVAYFEKHQKATRCLSIICCALVILTGLSTFIVAGLHSFS
jgi:ABC-type transport system involved in cytochrome c biogenesis permease subunit